MPLFKDAISYWGAVPINRKDLQSAIDSYNDARDVA